MITCGHVYKVTIRGYILINKITDMFSYVYYLIYTFKCINCTVVQTTLDYGPDFGGLMRIYGPSCPTHSDLHIYCVI